jgi:hypothetical protein
MKKFYPIEVAVSLQLEQVFSQAQQLSPQEQLQLADRLFGQVNRGNGADRALDDAPEAELEYVDGVLVVKTQQPGTLALDLVEFGRQQREERMHQVGGW